MYFRRAQLHAARGKPLLALPWYRRAHELDADQPLYGHAYALALHQQLAYREAESLYRQAEQRLRERCDADPGAHLPHLADLLNNLGSLQRHLEGPLEAERSYGEALEILRALARVDPTAHLPALARTLNNLGNLHAQMQRPGEAERAYLEALSIQREPAAQAGPLPGLPTPSATWAPCTRRPSARSGRSRRWARRSACCGG